MTHYTWHFEAVWENLALLLQGLWNTCLLAPLAMAVGLVVGLGIALLRLSGVWGLPTIAAGFTELFRTTPLLVQVIWVYTVLPLLTGIALSPFVSGLAALGLNVAAFMAEIYRTGITSINPSQTQSALALGMTRAQAMRRIILPQAVRRMIPPMTAMWVALFKDTSILATIGVVELMYQARVVASDTFRPLEVFTTVGIIYFLLTYPQALLVNWIYDRLRVHS
jgi:polar amino acid transport system permease protein